MVQTPVRTVTKSRVHEELVDFPTLPLSSWMRASFDLGGHFFLGGKGMDAVDKFLDILHDWWKRYELLDPGLPLFQEIDESQYRYCIPVAIHGDEGRGRYRKPIMIFSYQPLVTNFVGMANLKGCGVTKAHRKTLHVFMLHGQTCFKYKCHVFNKWLRPRSLSPLPGSPTATAFCTQQSRPPCMQRMTRP